VWRTTRLPFKSKKASTGVAPTSFSTQALELPNPLTLKRTLELATTQNLEQQQLSINMALDKIECSRFCVVANSSVRFNVSGFGNSSACVENDKNSQVMSKDFILHYLCLRL
jgi:hypothetical protein